MTCNHEASRNPRNLGRCYRCGSLIPDRNPDKERELIRRVTDDVELANIAYAWVVRRAGQTKPWERLLTRDWRIEGLEEAVDGIAYCLAEAARRNELGWEDELSSGRLMALHHFVQALRCLITDEDD
jgi:hypothetical protein